MVFYNPNNGAETTGKVTISQMKLGEGAFFSENVDFKNVKLYNNSTLLVNYPNEYESRFVMGTSLHSWNIYTNNFSYNPRLTENDTKVLNHINNLYLRDAKFNGVPFPSPRLVVYHNADNTYYAKGTSTQFRLLVPADFKVPKHYYGPWEVVAGKPLNTNQNNTCGIMFNPPHNCQKKIDGADIPDDFSHSFTCSDTPSENTSDPDENGYCYDYDAVRINPLSLANKAPAYYNNSQSYFEFKVEEIFQVNDNTQETELISQSPRTRTLPLAGEGERIIPISRLVSNNWTLRPTPDDEKDDMKLNVNGTSYFIENNLVDWTSSASIQNPCFTLCDGRMCDTPKAYIKTRDIRELKGGESAPNISLWQPEEGVKQHLVFLTYTIGFCPKTTSSGSSFNYTAYEMNHDVTNESELIDGKFIKTNSGWQEDAYVCLMRKVKCNAFSDTTHQTQPEISYKPISTDY